MRMTPHPDPKAFRKRPRVTRPLIPALIPVLIPALIPALMMALMMAFAALAPPAFAQNGPASVAEAKAQLATAKRRPSWRHPPGNVRAEDYHALFGNTVMVVNLFGTWGQQRQKTGAFAGSLMLVFIGRDGRYVWCSLRTDGQYETSDVRWSARKHTQRGYVYPALANGPGAVLLSPFYDAASGEMIWYGPWRGRWWDWNIGHLQARLPASTWDICPDFPSAKELGVGINPKQTALTYDGILAQDPGRRILRPDLVTPNPLEIRQ